MFKKIRVAEGAYGRDCGKYAYVLKHGFGPGTLPKNVGVCDYKDITGGYLKDVTIVWLDRPLTADELDFYDIPSETQLRKYLGDENYNRYILGENKSRRTGRRITEDIDTVAVRELLLYITNDERLYRSIVMPTIKNMQRKNKGVRYDSELAVKAWQYVADAGVRQYDKEYGSGRGSLTMMDKASRTQLARELRDYFDDTVFEESVKRNRRHGVRKESVLHEGLRDSIGYFIDTQLERSKIAPNQVIVVYDDNRNVMWLGKAEYYPMYLDNIQFVSCGYNSKYPNELWINAPETEYTSRFNEGIQSKRFRMNESAWTAPNGKKYGKQKRGSRWDYRFTTRELKNMVEDGVAISISDPNKANRIKDEIIGISWNNTNGYASGVLFTGKDGQYYVGNTGVASVLV